MVAQKLSMRWDLALLAFAFACFSAGFWRLWPGAAGLDTPPLGPLIFKAGIASMGLVAYAVRWEALGPVSLQRFDSILLIVVCLISAVWAILPAIALQQGILLLLVWVFGLTVAARLTMADLAATAAFSGVLALVAHVIAARGVVPASALDGDLSFSLACAIWACAASARWRWVWLVWAVSLVVVSILIGDFVGLYAAGGGIIAAGLSYGLRRLSADRPWTPIDVAIVIASFILMISLLALFTPIGRSLDIGGATNWIGYGFGVAGPSVAEAFAQGLGLLGVITGCLWALISTLRLAFARGASDFESSLVFGMWGAGLVALTLAPGEVAALGPWIVLLAGLSFGVGITASATASQSRVQSSAYRAAESGPMDRQALKGSQSLLTARSITPPHLDEWP